MGAGGLTAGLLQETILASALRGTSGGLTVQGCFQEDPGNRHLVIGLVG